MSTPKKVQCPRDNETFEPIIGQSYNGGGKGIWCPKCGATYNYDSNSDKWTVSGYVLKIIETETEKCKYQTVFSGKDFCLLVSPIYPCTFKDCQYCETRYFALKKNQPVPDRNQKIKEYFS